MAAHQTKAEVMVIEFEYRVQSRAAAREDVIIIIIMLFFLIIKGGERASKIQMMIDAPPSTDYLSS